MYIFGYGRGIWINLVMSNLWSRYLIGMLMLRKRVVLLMVVWVVWWIVMIGWFRCGGVGYEEVCIVRGWKRDRWW